MDDREKKEEEILDVEENRRRLKEVLETVLAFDFPLHELDRK
ncbi:hypothetical protein A0J61_10748, partial [Choanephora cucurbitarum]